MDGIYEIKEPEVRMVFKSSEDVLNYYTNYAKLKGFGVMTRSSTRDDDGNLKYCTLACVKNKKGEIHSRNSLVPKLSRKTGCKAKIRIKAYDDENLIITTVELGHNHDLSPGKARHLRCHRKLNEHVKRRLEINDQARIRLSKNYHSLVVDAGGHENVTFNERDYRNYIVKARENRLGVGDAGAVSKYFVKMQKSDPNFFYVIDFDEDNRIRNLFWADGRSRAAYESFADVITFDTTYLTNKYHMPFAPFVGVNHHGNSILFGCGLLTNEDTQSFVWLFESWLNCMARYHPKAIITDQCKAIQNAIEIVFHTAKHRWCLWHIMKKLPEKLRGYSEYEGIKEALQTITYDSLTEDDFEKSWSLMISSYDLGKNEWLEGLYRERLRWVPPAYVKQSFWAGMSTTQRSEGMNAFFGGYVNSKTSLKQFVEQYDKALESIAEKERVADFQSFNSRYECLSNYDIEKQFQTFYTNAKFKEFQEELMGKFYCLPSLVKQDGSTYVFEVAEDVNVGGKRRDLNFTVHFNEIECEVKCKCRLFEFRGILCRHALSVLIVRKINEVPPRYILSRWRKDLKRGYNFVKCSYITSSEQTERCENIYNEVRELATFVANDKEKYEIVINGIKELKARVGTPEIMSTQNKVVPYLEEQTFANEQNVSIGTNRVLSPLVTRQKGRPPSKRRVSKMEQVVERLKRRKKNKQVEEKDSKKPKSRKTNPIKSLEVGYMVTPSNLGKPYISNEFGVIQPPIIGGYPMPWNGYSNVGNMMLRGNYNELDAYTPQENLNLFGSSIHQRPT